MCVVGFFITNDWTLSIESVKTTRNTNVFQVRGTGVILAKDLSVRMRILVERKRKVHVRDVSGDYQKLTPLSMEKEECIDLPGCWCDEDGEDLRNFIIYGS